MIKNLSDLTWDKKVYPRSNLSSRTIDAYAESMAIGAQFPAIEIQRVSNYRNGGTEPGEAWLIIDGIHRLHAHDRLKQAEVEVIEWKPGQVLDYEQTWIELCLISACRNITHGDRLAETDKKATARLIAESDPDRHYTEEMIGANLSVARQRVNEWVSDIRARQKAGRDNAIIKLARLGWTQEEIAGVVGVDQSVVSRIMQNADFGKLHNFIEQGQTMEWVCEHYGIELALAWAMRLEGKTDQEIFEALGWGLRTWDNWYFNDCDERFGDDWPGRIPAQLVAHTLFYFTRPGDMVLDPMAGGGVVPDVCLAFGRKCRAFDVATRKTRLEIESHYWQPDQVAWPDSKKKPQLIFCDPPYFSKKESAYQEKAGEYLAISSLPRNDYLNFFDQFFAVARQNIRPEGYLAFLNADWRDFESTPAHQENYQNAITVLDYADLIKKNGWSITHIIDCPMSTQRFNGGIVQSMQEKRILGVVRRTLLIAKAA